MQSKTFTRFTSVIVVLMILISMFAMCVSADENTIVFSDVDESDPYYTAIYSLVNRGVINGYEDGTFKSENTITRAEFATILARATSNGVVLTATTDKFADVPVDHWANIYIAYAVSTGAVNGYEDGSFKPDNEVTYGEAVKMIVCTMGYGKFITPGEPWYQPYITMANQINLTKNAGGAGDMKASRGIVAQLIYNINNCKEVVQTGVDSTGKPTYGTSKVSDDEDESGVITAAFESSLDGSDTGLSKQQVKIDDKIFYIGDNPIDKFIQNLGRTISFKYDEGSKNVITTIESIDSKKEITITDTMIESVSGREITYYEKDTDRKASVAKLSDKLNVIYNGKGVNTKDIDEEFIKKYFNVSTGEIKLISNKTTSQFDVAFITSYTTYCVTSVSSDKDIYTIYDTYGPNKEITLDDDRCEVNKISTLDGTPASVTLSSVAKNNIVSVAMPLDSDDGVKVMISAIKITGKVDSFPSSSTITISDKEYDVGEYFDYLVTSEPSKYSLASGDSAAFYFDFRGKLAYISKTESSDPYAYLMAITDSRSLNSVRRVQLFTTSGSVVEYNLKDKIKVNGTQYSADVAADILKANASVINSKHDPSKIINGEYSQLIKYRTGTSNGETVITEIFTISTTDPDNGNIVSYEFRTNANDAKDRYSDGESKLKYRTSGRAFQDDSATNQFIMSTTTVVFNIPDDRSDDENYKKRSYSYFSDGTSYVVEPYDVTNNTAKVVLVYGGAKASMVQIYTDSDYALIEKINSTKKSGEDEIVQKVTYYTSGSDKTTTTNTRKENTVDGLKPGDIVRFGIENNEIVGYQALYVGGVLYDFDAGDPYTTFEASSNSIVHNDNASNECKVMLGTVADIGDSTISVVPQIVENDDDFEADKWQSFNLSDSTTKYYKWDSSNDEYKLLTKDSIVTVEDSSPTAASKVLVISLRKTVKAIYIIK